MDVMQVRAQLLRRAEASRAQIDAILSVPDADAELIRQHLRTYVLGRLGLDETVEEENILRLSGMSIARSVELANQGVQVSDISPGCSGVSSEAAKKALLLVTLQKALDIRLDKERAAYLETLSDLASELSRCLKAKG